MFNGIRNDWFYGRGIPLDNSHAWRRWCNCLTKEERQEGFDADQDRREEEIALTEIAISNVAMRGQLDDRLLREKL